MPLPPPVKVHPLIKLTRWGALIYGIYYGYNRRAELQVLENERRAEEERTREDRERYLAEEKGRIEKRDIKEIEKAIFGDNAVEL